MRNGECIGKKTQLCLTAGDLNAIIALSIYHFSTLKREREMKPVGKSPFVNRKGYPAGRIRSTVKKMGTEQ